VNLRDHLLAIKQKRGELTPKIVLEEARSVSHPLHHRFDWDKDVAAEKWLLHQAHRLIMEVEITYIKNDGTPSRVRAFHAIRQNNNSYVYESTDELRADPVSREVILREMERDWLQLKERYEAFEEFWELVNETKPNEIQVRR
jgi:hypothetical protein